MVARPDPVTAWSSPHALLPLDQKAKWIDHIQQPALQMAFIHNAIIRGLNTLIFYAPRLGPGQVDSFVQYAEAWARLVHSHHESEETVAFDAYEKKLGKGALSVNVVQHEEFTPQIEGFAEWLKSVREKKAQWSVQTFQKHVDSFDKLLVKHLTVEVETIAPEKIAAAGFTSAEIAKVNAAIDAEVQRCTPLDALLFCLLQHAHASHPDAHCFPPVPKPIDWFFRVYKYYWLSDVLQFSSCDNWSRLKPLPQQAM